MSIPNHNSKHTGSRNKVTIIGLGILLSMAALLALVVKLNNNGNTQPASAATRPAATAASSEEAVTPAPEAVTLVIKSDEEKGKKGSDGAWHDAYLPADFSVKAGATVEVTVYNYDDMPHTFTSPGLGVNARIAAGGETHPSKTTFTFQVPSKAATYQNAGSYEWYCALPCDPFSMTHYGFMKGHVTVS